MPAPIDLIFLGTGSGIPSLKRHHPSILLRKEGDCMLFDCGESVQLALQQARTSPVKIKRIFITHWHADHFSGLLPLIETLHLMDRKTPLEVYGPDASRFVDALIDLSYWGIGFEIIARDVSTDKKEKIFSSDYEIYSIPVKHSVPSVGYLFKEKDRWKINMRKAKRYGLQGKILQKIKEKGKIKVRNKLVRLADIADLSKGRKIIYSGDTLPCKSLFAEAKDAVLIHDSTFIEHEEASGSSIHSTAIEVAKLSKRYGVKKLILTHFSRRYQSSREILKAVKPIFPKTIVAEDLMKIVL